MDWYGNEDIRLIWKENAIEALNQYLYKSINNIEINETLTKNIDIKSNKLISSEWLLSGIGFQFDDKYLTVYNAFDEIGFAHNKNRNDRYISLSNS